MHDQGHEVHILTGSPAGHRGRRPNARRNRARARRGWAVATSRSLEQAARAPCAASTSAQVSEIHRRGHPSDRVDLQHPLVLACDRPAAHPRALDEAVLRHNGSPLATSGAMDRVRTSGRSATDSAAVAVGAASVTIHRGARAAPTPRRRLDSARRQQRLRSASVDEPLSMARVGRRDQTSGDPDVVPEPRDSARALLGISPTERVGLVFRACTREEGPRCRVSRVCRRFRAEPADRGGDGHAASAR